MGYEAVGWGAAGGGAVILFLRFVAWDSLRMMVGRFSENGDSERASQVFNEMKRRQGNN